MKKKIKEIKEKIEKNKYYRLFMMNFKAPLVIGIIGFIIYSFENISNVNFFNEYNHKLIFFVGSLLIFTIIVIKLVIDIFSILFGEKGKGSLVKRDK